jgi:DNA polymerase
MDSVHTGVPIRDIPGNYNGKTWYAHAIGSPTLRIALDFETYYDTDYSLKKLHTLEYVRDERFLVHGCAVKVDDGDTIFLPRDDFKTWIRGVDASNAEVICHNAYFDGLVLFEHYGFVPRVYRDTLSMAKGILPHHREHNLDYLAKLFGLGNKLPEILSLTKGRRELPPDLIAQLGEYAKNDVDIMLLIYEKLLPAIPEDELQLIDLTIKWGARPVLHVDLPRAEKALKAAIQDRNSKIAASGTILDVLSSQPKFTKYLETLGIEVPLKDNGKGKMIPALGKDDIGFRQMMADYPEHSKLFKGRMAAKSTIDVTRIKRVHDIGSRGTLPMPLKYYGAHTGRWSGADGLNPQNFRRGSELRKSIIAPPGYVILVSDLKQIELRVNAWFCNEDFWLGVLRSGEDVYKVAAANHFGIALDAVTDSQRFFGKTLELGLGYQMGFQKFRTTCALKDIHLTEIEAYETVQSYRASHNKIRRKWEQLKGHLGGMYQAGYEVSEGPVVLVHEGILLPNGMRLDYTGLHPTETGNWYYGVNKFTKIYGGKMLENIIQALARIVIGEQILEIERSGITTVSSTHDEILAVVRESEAEAALQEVSRIMCTPPSWAPDLPLDVDAGYAKEYSK